MNNLYESTIISYAFIMNRLNWIFAVSSFSVILITIERFSFTTKILLQPYNFLRLHEFIQMTFLILLTVIIPFFLLREITSNFKTINSKKSFLLVLLFIIGIYFYATGNGVHEVSSFFFNTYCDTQEIVSVLCQGLFVNDYYTGNIMYFLGSSFMIVTLLLLEKGRPNKNFQKKDLVPLIINSLIYAFAIFAYAAFDRVLVGLIYSIFIAIFASIMFVSVKRNYLQYPVITYTALTYVLASITAAVVRVYY